MRLDRGLGWRLADEGARLQLVFALGACLLARAPLALAQAASPAASSGQESGQGEYARVVEAAVEAYNRDDYTTARRYFSRAHELRPSARTWRGLGTTAFELKLYDDAVRELTFALEDTRSALPPNLRAETELTLRVSRRRLADADAPNAAVPKPELTASTSSEPASAAPPAPVSATQALPAEQDGGLDGQRVAAIVAGAVGVVAVGVGVGFGLHSIAKGRDRDRLCPASEQALGCSPEAKRAADAAITAGNLSTMGWVIGGVGLASGVVLWLTATERASSEASVSFGPGSVDVFARF